MQQPSSLVFLVIIAVWAVYFVQYWVRRREHLATARSVDQFSESMRVLERRTPLPTTDLSTPTRPSYAVSPARAARPQVLVKRAETTAAAQPVDPQPEPRQSARQSARQSPAVRPPRKARGLVLLASLVAVPVVAVLGLLGTVPVWGALVPVVALAASVAWVRSAVSAERAAREASRPARPVRRPAAAPAAPVAAAAPVASEPVAPAPVEGPVADALPTESNGDEDVRVPRRQEVYDGSAVEVAAPVPAPVVETPVVRLLVDEDDIPLTWDPVPVPPPTYTMKARVTRPAPTSADLVGDADTEYAPEAESEAAEPVRRVAGA